MVKYKTDPLDAIFHALADPTRRAILARLARGEASVGELADPHDMSLPAVSKHLNVLETAGLLDRRRDGRLRLCRMDPEPLLKAASWIEDHYRFWHTQFEQLDEFLKESAADWPNPTEPKEPKESRDGPSTTSTSS